MFGVGSMEFFILCVVALLLFGDRLPSVMRSVGSGISELKRGMSDIQEQVRKGADDAGK